MAAPKVEFALYNNDGSPRTTGTPSFHAYKDRLGANRVQPGISHMGGGIYVFQPTDGDQSTGVIFSVSDGAGADKRWVSGCFGPAELVGFGLFGVDGEPTAAPTPAFATYKRSDTGADVLQPVIGNLGLGLFAFTIAASEMATGVAFELSTGSNPARLFGESDAPTLLTGISAVGSNKTITVTLSSAAALTGASLTPAGWGLGGGVGTLPTITAVALTNPTTVTLTLNTELVTGSYTLTVAAGIFSIVTGNPYISPAQLPFSAVGVGPTVILGRSIDGRTLEIMFSEPVVQSEAEIAANYSIDNGLSAVSAKKVTDAVYRITTSKQTVGVSYLVTVSNIHDLSGNLI